MTQRNDGPKQQHLTLDRERYGDLSSFENWRLSKEPLVRGDTIICSLPTSLYVSDVTGGTDYVTNYHRAFWNGCMMQQHSGNIYFCCHRPTEGNSFSSKVYRDKNYIHTKNGKDGEIGETHGFEMEEASLQMNAEPGKTPGMRVCQLKGNISSGDGVMIQPIFDTTIDPQQTVLDHPLMPSVVEVMTCHRSHSIGEEISETIVLSSSGQGDLTVSICQSEAFCSSPSSTGIHSRTNAQFEVTSPFYPLRPSPPLKGVRSFEILCAVKDPEDNDFITAIIWSVGELQKGGGKHCCEIYALSINIKDPLIHSTDISRSKAGKLRNSPIINEVQLLTRSLLPPHGAICNPESNDILLIVEPFENQENTFTDESLQNINKEEEEEEMEEISPRTLQAAASRLEHLTSEENLDQRKEPFLQNRCVDVFRETGPDEIGGLGSEPGCELLFFMKSRCSKSTIDSEQPSESESSLNKMPFQAYQCVEQVSCLPHRFLGCHMTSTGHLRLALTDDVDCALIDVNPCTNRASNSSEDVAEKSSQERDLINLFAGFCIEQTGSIPALGYIASGKIHRKYLLLGKSGNEACIAAALVESRRYMYLYRQEEIWDRYGEQQILDLGPWKQNVQDEIMGAALVASIATPEDDVDYRIPKNDQILLLTNKELICLKV